MQPETHTRPVELPAPEPDPDLTIEIAFLPFEPNDPPLRAIATLALHRLGLLVSGFEVRQWPGVNGGLVRVDFPKPTARRRSVVAWNLRLRDLIAAAYLHHLEAKHTAGTHVACCRTLHTLLLATRDQVPPELAWMLHDARCPHRERWVGSLGREAWSAEELVDYADALQAGSTADVCKAIARLAPLEAALVAVRVAEQRPLGLTDALMSDVDAPDPAGA